MCLFNLPVSTLLPGLKHTSPFKTSAFASLYLSHRLPLLSKKEKDLQHLTMAIRSESAMILRDLSAFNMGRGAYDTTGVKKPGAPPPPPSTR